MEGEYEKKKSNVTENGGDARCVSDFRNASLCIISNTA